MSTGAPIVAAAAPLASRLAIVTAVAMTVVFGTVAVLSLSTFPTLNRAPVHVLGTARASYSMPPVSEGIPAPLLARLTRVEIALPAAPTSSRPLRRDRRQSPVPAAAIALLPIARATGLPDALSMSLTVPGALIEGNAPRPAAALAGSAEDERNIRTTIRSYGQAFERLDVEATAVIWPSVDRRALARAFGTLRSQWLRIAECAIAVNGAEATARCVGTLEFVPKIGRQERILSPQHWTFTMRRHRGGWRIENVSATPRTATADPL